jgi:hypothetical protein
LAPEDAGTRRRRVAGGRGGAGSGRGPACCGPSRGRLARHRNFRRRDEAATLVTGARRLATELSAITETDLRIDLPSGGHPLILPSGRARALAKLVEKHFASAAEFIQALRPLAAARKAQPPKREDRW